MGYPPPESAPPAVRALRAFGLTDRGRVRERNEDAYLVRPDLGLFAVCDGMGGMGGGEAAARLAIEALAECVAASPRLSATAAASGAPPDRTLAGIVQDLDRAFRSQRRAVGGLEHAGTTLLACLVRDGRASLVHLGDSRAYLLRGGWLERLTEDHTLVALLRRTGRLSGPALRRHEKRHLLTRYFGAADAVPPDHATLVLEPDDRLLLSSDGLTAMLSDRTIGHIVSRAPTVETAARRLVTAALAGGGHDNVTVVALEPAVENRRRRGSRRPVRVRRRVGYSLGRGDDGDGSSSRGTGGAEGDE